MSKCMTRQKSLQCVCIFCLIVPASGYAQPHDPIRISVSPQVAALATGESMQFTAAGDPAGVWWSVSSFTHSVPGVPVASGTIDASGNYTAPSNTQSLIVTVTVTSKRDPAKSASALINVVAPGQVTSTNNVQVAQYTISPAAPANVSIQFGTDTTYGLTTWSRPTGQFGGPVSLYVAGMKANALYHMRAVVQFDDGTQFTDADHTFTTGALEASLLPSITTTTTPGMMPQTGVELLALLTVANPQNLDTVVTDLEGNTLWAYSPGLSSLVPNPIKLLPNGHFLMNFSSTEGDGISSVIQEVDLGGNLIWEMTAAQLNQALAAATCNGCNITVVGTHHDFVILPNGHLIVIASTQQVVSGVTVTGDVLIDLDRNHNPVWLWNAFDHLDINRRPYMFPDWTHTNAVLYSPDDGNLIISMRHQNWLIKIDYDHGRGSGDILWHLGYQGDFTLMNSDGTVDTNPTDWFYAQHGPSFASKNSDDGRDSGDIPERLGHQGDLRLMNSAGAADNPIDWFDAQHRPSFAIKREKFSLVLFDNGDDRGVSVVAGGTCGVAGQPACYSTVPILQLDETAKTATLAFHPTTPDYSTFGGNAEVLENGNVEFDECAATALPSTNAAIYEVTQAWPPQTTWQMKIAGRYAYRAMRLPSLYPGVQW